MPLARLEIPPGFFTDATDYSVGPRWQRGDKVRFWNGFPEKIGGWVKTDSEQFSGICRGMHVWADLDNIIWLGFGTHTHLYVFLFGTFSDITPIRASGTLGSDPITTTISSDQVSIAHTAHGLAENDRVAFSGATAVGGITIDGEYTVDSVTDANTYVIIHSSAATSSATGGGASVAYTYYLPVGFVNSTLFGGWGVDGWGEGGWGEGSATAGARKPPRTWSFVNWGEDLIANPSGGEIYEWDTSVGVGTPAAKLSNSPDTNFIILSPADRHLIAIGSDQGTGTMDEMLVHWCDQEDNTLWTAAATNTAGTFRLTEGSRLISGLNTRGHSLIWSDTAVYSMQFLGPPYTFGFDLLATNCGIIGPHARAEIGGRVFWWGRSSHNFYVYDGGVDVLPCPIQNTISDDVNLGQQDKTFAVTRASRNEVWFYYTSNASNEIDSYVIYNYKDNTWANGKLNMTAGLDRGFFDLPVYAGDDNYLYDFESGTDADDAAMDAYVETGEFEITPGDRLALIDKMVVDATITGNLDITVKTRRYPNAAETSKGPYSIDSDDGKVSFRSKGRTVAFRFGSDALSDDWRLGTMRMQIKRAGGR